MKNAEKQLVRLIESVVGRELSRTESECAREIFECLEDSIQMSTMEMCYEAIEEIDGIEFDEEFGFQVQATSHSHE